MTLPLNAVICPERRSHISLTLASLSVVSSAVLPCTNFSFAGCAPPFPKVDVRNGTRKKISASTLKESLSALLTRSIASLCFTFPGEVALRRLWVKDEPIERLASLVTPCASSPGDGNVPCLQFVMF
jgi:hypothetical protein